MIFKVLIRISKQTMDPSRSEIRKESSVLDPYSLKMDPNPAKNIKKDLESVSKLFLNTFGEKMTTNDKTFS